MAITADLVEEMGVRAACAGMGLPRATYYRACREARSALHTVRRPRKSPLALSPNECQEIVDVLHSPEYVDVAPRTAYAMLLDAGIFLASVSTFYRILRASSGTRERRDELTHPAYARPELLSLNIDTRVASPLASNTVIPAQGAPPKPAADPRDLADLQQIAVLMHQPQSADSAQGAYLAAIAQMLEKAP